MTLPGRRLKKYHPRRSRYTVKAQKQELYDYEHRISKDLSRLLVLIQNGTSEQIQNASIQMQSDINKYSSEMSKLAREMKGPFPKVVQDYLNSVKSIATSALGWIDDQKIDHCYQATQKLQKLVNLND